MCGLGNPTRFGLPLRNTISQINGDYLPAPRTLHFDEAGSGGDLVEDAPPTDRAFLHDFGFIIITAHRSTSFSSLSIRTNA